MTGTISRMLGFSAGHVFITDSYERLNTRLIRLDHADRILMKSL